MEKEEIIGHLESVLTKQRKYEALDSELYEAKKHQDYLNSLNENSLRDFDRAKKEDYIRRLAGPEPQPLFFKTQKWQDKHDAWQRARERAEQQYFSFYKEQRDELQIERIFERRSENVQKINNLETEMHEITDSMESEELVLGSDIQTSENISALIEILKNQRADTLKGAMNVLYADLFRKNMEESVKNINLRLNALEERVKSYHTNFKELKARVEDTRDWLQMVQDRVEDLEGDDDEDDEYDNDEDEDDDEDS